MLGVLFGANLPRQGMAEKYRKNFICIVYNE